MKEDVVAVFHRIKEEEIHLNKGSIITTTEEYTTFKKESSTITTTVCA